MTEVPMMLLVTAVLTYRQLLYTEMSKEKERSKYEDSATVKLMAVSLNCCLLLFFLSETSLHLDLDI